MKFTFLKKIKHCLLGTALIISASVSAETVYSVPTPEINNAEAYILIDANSGAILAEHNADVKRDPASLTKMMTSYVIGEAIKSGRINNNDVVLVSNEASQATNPLLQGSSLMFLKPKESVTVELLNKGIIIQSGNDACIAMAEHVSGTQNVFVSEMNKYAKELGLKDTYFETVHGLDSSGQYTTARDMAYLGQALINNLPDEYAIYKEKQFEHNKVKQSNRNGLLWDKTLAVDGIKTGHTNGAGYNLVSSATQGDMRLIAVVMGADTAKNREAESKKLLVWGFRQFETLYPIKPNQEMLTETVWYGNKNKIKLGSINGVAVTVPVADKDKLEVEYKLNDQYLSAPIQKGAQVGEAIYTLEGKVIAVSPIEALEDVEEAGFFGRIWDWICLQIWLLFN